MKTLCLTITLILASGYSAGDNDKETSLLMPKPRLTTFKKSPPKTQTNPDTTTDTLEDFDPLKNPHGSPSESSSNSSSDSDNESISSSKDSSDDEEDFLVQKPPANISLASSAPQDILQPRNKDDITFNVGSPPEEQSYINQGILTDPAKK